MQSLYNNSRDTMLKSLKVSIYTHIFKMCYALQYLNLGICVISLSVISIQRISGGGLPCAEQLSMAPLELVNSRRGGGSCRKTGPCA